jgi:hypothetical protein
MGRKEKTPIIIFTVFKDNETKQHNTDVHETIKVSLQSKNIGFKELMGVYKGSCKMNLLVRAEHENVVLDLCKQFKQEYYIYSGPERNTETVSIDGKKQFLGTLKRINEREAITLDFFTYDFSDHSCWAIK